MNRFLLAASGAAIIAAASPAMAQESRLEGVQLAAADRPEGGTIVVTARRTDSDPASKASTFVGLPTSNLDTARTVNVITSETIDQQQPTNIISLLRNVTSLGFTTNGDTAGVNAAQTIRGLSIAEYYVDGQRNSYFANVASVFLQTIENIEVLEGPAGTITGGSNLGGTINFVTKKPSFTPRYFVQGGIGYTDSTDTPIYNGVVDATGPLSDTFAYRFVASVQSSDTLAKGIAASKTYVIAPSITARLGERGTATLNVDYGYQRQYYADFAGFPANGTLLPNASGVRFDATSVFTPVNSYLEQKNFDARLVVDYQLQDRLKVVASANHTHLAWKQLQGILFSLADPVAQNKETLSLGYGEYPQTYTSGQIRFVSDAKIFGAENILMGGVEYFRGLNVYEASRRQTLVTVSLPYTPTIFDYSTLALNPAGNSRDELIQKSVFLQDQFSPVEWLNLTGGVRFDHVRDVATSLAGRFVLNKDKVTYNGAVSVKPTENSNIYVLYGTGFRPPAATSQSFTGQTFKPEQGSNLEGGIKVKVLGNLFARAAVFHQIRENVLTPDPVNFGYSVATGKVRVDGGEFNVTGQPVRGLDLIVSYTHLSSKILADNTTVNGVPFANVGRRILNVADDALRLYAHYNFADESPLHGVGIGGGLTYSSDVDVVNNITSASIIPLVPNTLGTGTVPNPTVRNLTLPSYTIFDANASYTFKNYKVALSATNLFDKRYYPNGRNVGRIYIGRPRSVLLTVSAAF